MTPPKPRIGVVIVSFQSADILDECLESLFASSGAELRVVVVDNNSTDTSCAVVRDWASGKTPYRVRTESPIGLAAGVPKPVTSIEIACDAPPPLDVPLVLVKSTVNGGYAYGVNQGLKVLLADSTIQLFWILNPDCVVAPATPAAIATAAQAGPFSLLGGRAIYYERPHEIQTDGGLVSRLTGRCISLHSGRPSSKTAMPNPASLDYITGASVVITRDFIDKAGLMPEDYFLYYEEVDWAFRRANLPLRVSEDMIVYHRGGTSIGTGDTTRRPSPFANYFNYRNRMRFVRRFMPSSAPGAIAYALAKAAQLVLKGASDEAAALLAGTFGLPPPAKVRGRIVDPAARVKAFGDAS